jgi:glycosyltransferase involved in cell wall biosynthesis
MPKLCVLVPARNCAQFLPELISRVSLPGADDEIVIVDDASADGTSAVGQKLPRVRVVRNDTQLGYGGTSKRLFKLALEGGADLAVNIHGDLGHAPEAIGSMLPDVVSGRCDLVVASRLLYLLNELRRDGWGSLRRSERRGNMPFSRILGHLAITKIQNICYGTQLHSFHEGMRACTRRVMEWALREDLPDWYDFDTHLIFRAHRAGFRLGEVPLPPHYTPAAVSGVPVLQYGLRAVGTAIRHNRFYSSG